MRSSAGNKWCGACIDSVGATEVEEGKDRIGEGISHSLDDSLKFAKGAK